MQLIKYNHINFLFFLYTRLYVIMIVYKIIKIIQN